LNPLPTRRQVKFNGNAGIIVESAAYMNAKSLAWIEAALLNVTISCKAPPL
jgi:hypothetical protein